MGLRGKNLKEVFNNVTVPNENEIRSRLGMFSITNVRMLKTKTMPA